MTEKMDLEQMEKLIKRVNSDTIDFWKSFQRTGREIDKLFGSVLFQNQKIRRKNGNFHEIN